MIRRPLEPGFSRDGFYRLQVLPRKLGHRQDRAFGPLYSATGHAQSWRLRFRPPEETRVRKEAKAIHHLVRLSTAAQDSRPAR